MDCSSGIGLRGVPKPSAAQDVKAEATDTKRNPWPQDGECPRCAVPLDYAELVVAHHRRRDGAADGVPRFDGRADIVWEACSDEHAICPLCIAEFELPDSYDFAG